MPTLYFLCELTAGIEHTVYPNRDKFAIHCISDAVYCLFVCLFDGVQHHFQQYFSYIVALSVIGGGNRRTRRKPPTCRKLRPTLLRNVGTPRPDRDSNSQHQW